MFELLYIVIAILGSSVAGIWDLKTTNIPDPLIYGMAASGILLHLIESLYIGSYTPLIESLTVGGIFLAFALFMYFTGQWGGGDGGILASIGFLVPVFSKPMFFPFPLSFFINMVFVGAFYSLFYILLVSFRDKKVMKEFNKEMKSKRTRMTIISLFAFSIITLLFTDLFLLSVSIIIGILLFILYHYAKIVETRFYKKISTKKLQVDDMIGEDLPKINVYKQRIRGLTEKEVKAIKKHKKYVLIREGIRYSPVFVIALILTLLYGDIFFNLLI